ncbi:MAG: Gp49 family protein [Woeseiaceae bacterium]|nr:Gp49 family protein [Woeseiaceae bacterium]
MATRDRVSLQQRFLAEGKTNFVTTEAVEAAITGAQFHHFPESTVTVCLLELANGFTIVGQSACVNPDNFDAALGRELAQEDAKQQVYRFLAFRMMDTPEN